ncbi:ABC-2 family transporter protein [Streptomyces sp. YIM 130001]|uniref:ABC transporter permease n=1 Tax=Streptomyces sp. YIM 130001 TaxID=2259644 RepID=UPI000E65E7B4|nr:ABC transporter permease [Streptomyces sp. YIM 130001]RII12021.1 ABC-2 family transporter protein [Streptomyces sp. YIM 130001]
MSHTPEESPASRAAHWAAFKRSPFLPATVLVLILAAAAALFAAAYTYAMANPTPHNIPTAVTGQYEQPRGKEFLTGMEKALDAELDLRPYGSRAEAREAIDEQRVYAVLDVAGDGRRVHLEVSSASGFSVAEVFTQAASPVSRATGIPVTVEDLRPLQSGDPRGLTIFYISLAAVIIGFVGAIQLSVHARGLNPAERIACTAAYALLGGFAVAAVVDWGLGAVDLPFVESWLILALTMFACGMVFTMFNTFFHRWSMIPTWGLLVLLGNPASGGAVAPPLLPTVIGRLGQWLPPGASVNAQHTAVYFQGHQHAFPFLVLGGWSVLAGGLFWFWRHRHPGGREPADAPAAPA